MSLRQVYIKISIYFQILRWFSQETISPLSSKMALDEDSKPHQDIPSGILYYHWWRHRWLHWRGDLAPSHQELKESSPFGTSRKWGDHTPGSISYCRKISNATQDNHSGNLILWMDKSSTYYTEHWMRPLHQELLSIVESYPIPEEQWWCHPSENFEDGINLKMVWGI